MTKNTFILATTLLLAIPAMQGAASADSGDWPQWRGPLATGEAPGANPPLTWSETEHVKWKVKIPGSGTATPVILGNLVFVQTAVPTGKKVQTAASEEKPTQTPPPAPGAPGGRRGGPGGGRAEKPTETYKFSVMALDRETGKTVWEKVAREEVPHEGHHPDHGFSSYSALTDGQNVYAFFGSRGLHVYDLKGNLKWEKDLGRMQTKMGFGEGSSPAVYGNTLVINWDHQGDDFIVALDKNTGKELWRQAREEETSWATPVVVQHGGKAQVVTSATGKIRSYDLASGKLLWECKGMTANAIPSPVPGDDVVYATSGFRGAALMAIKLGGNGDVTDSDAVLWKHTRSTPYVPSPLLYQGKLYFISVNNALVSIVDAKDGKVNVDAERIPELNGVYASPVAANGRVYIVGRNGTTAVLKAGEKMEILATNKLDEKIDASPAIAGRHLFLRGHESLYCISE